MGDYNKKSFTTLVPGHRTVKPTSLARMSKNPEDMESNLKTESKLVLNMDIVFWSWLL